MPDSVSAIAFALLALACVGGAIGMLVTRNVVHAAFWLLEVMIALAGLFLLLSAEFVAMVQLLVYAGAVAVLVLFVIMLTLRRREDAIRPRDWSWPAAAIAVLFGGIAAVAVARMPAIKADMPSIAPGVAAFGRELFTTWMVPFELASLVLLVALIGAVWWSKEGED
jgi:NADH-quinone oxidoreductase subunit J